MGANGACKGDNKYMYMYSSLLTRECLLFYKGFYCILAILV